MKYKNYSSEIWERIENTLNQIKHIDPNPIAAFDADGTLWDTDLGEAFFQFQIDHKLVPLPRDPWGYYKELKKKNNDPREAYLWLAQINKGIPVTELKQWAEEAFKKYFPPPVFPDQKKLIAFLKSNGVTVYIVTASVKWAVEPGAMFLGLHHDQVIGVETKIVDGKITDELSGNVTHREGKVRALLSYTNQKKPFLAAGNTMGDLPLIESATHIRLAVSSINDENHKLYSTEKELLQISEQNGWITHRFFES